MEPNELIKQVAAGEVAEVESRWLQHVDADGVDGTAFARFDTVIAELVKRGQGELAETLSWAAIETIAARKGPRAALVVAGPFLVALGESEELRREVTDLYRAAYPDVEELEALLTEAGLPGGRPVRRAVRTLEVCLAVGEGDYLTSRDSHEAARIERIDRPAWSYEISTGAERETLGAVHLADRFAPAGPDDFQVLRHFERERLAERVQREPGDMVLAICRMHDNKIDSDQLRDFLVPDLVSADDWKKWWTKARTELKHNPNVHLEGRSPYEITFLDDAVHFDDRMLKEFDSKRDPVAQGAIVEQYLRDCKARSETPSAEALRHCYESFKKRAERATRQENDRAGLLWLLARRTGTAAGVEGAEHGIVEVLRQSEDPAAVLAPIDDPGLLELACDSIVEARPGDWQDRLLDVLPDLPMSVCDGVATRILDAGRPMADLQAAIATAMGSPARHCEALLWLWDGPSKPEIAADIPAVTLLSRIVRGLQDARIGHNVEKELAKRIAARAKSVLAARNYERFEQCIAQIDRPMANALRTQISKLDTLGRVVKEDLLNRLRARFPLQDTKREVAPWAREDRLYVTERGLSKKQAEIDHHVNVKMKENARAIGAAAEHGDLSENSEYKFALEERDLLRAMLAQMNTEMAMAVVLTPDDVPTDHIGIGTRAVFRRLADGQRYELGLVGPWDADPRQNLLNYKSPLAQRLLGKRVGDVVEFSHADVIGEFELIELRNALESGMDSEE